MKTLEEILKQEPVYLYGWTNKFGLIADFENCYITEEEFKAEVSPYPNIEAWEERKASMTKALEDYKDVNVLFASYGTDNYSGDAFVLFEKEGKLYEVNGSHCSCYGLEEQFAPEETTLEAIAFRLSNGTMGVDAYSGNEFAEELKKFIGI